MDDEDVCRDGKPEVEVCVEEITVNEVPEDVDKSFEEHNAIMDERYGDVEWSRCVDGFADSKDDAGVLLTRCVIAGVRARMRIDHCAKRNVITSEMVSLMKRCGAKVWVDTNDTCLLGGYDGRMMRVLGRLRGVDRCLVKGAWVAMEEVYVVQCRACKLTLGNDSIVKSRIDVITHGERVEVRVKGGMEEGANEISKEEWERLMGEDDPQKVNEILKGMVKEWFPSLGAERLDGLKDEEAALGIPDEVRQQKPIHLRSSGSRAYRERVGALVAEWLESDICEEVVDPLEQKRLWVTRMLAVSKGGGRGDRGVLDMRPQNKVCERVKGTVPNMDDIIGWLRDGESKIFGNLDKRRAFCQLFIQEEDRFLVGFEVNGVLYRMKRMPQGHCNAADEFQMAMERILRGCGDCLRVYIDDIFLKGKDKRSYICGLFRALRRLNDARSRLNLDKCIFYAHEVKTLGRIVSHGGVRLEDERLEVLSNLEAPRDQDSLRRWLGMVGWINTHIDSCSAVLEPLYDLVGKGKRVRLKEEHTEAVKEIKKTLGKMRDDGGMLANPRDEGEVVVRPDACKAAIGGSVLQEQEGAERPLGYYGRILRGYELNRHIRDKELMAIVLLVMKARALVGYHKHITVYTDHLGLVRLLEKDLEQMSEVQKRLTMDLRELGPITLRFIPGKDNHIADFFSREVIITPETVEEMAQHGVEQRRVDKDPWGIDYLQYRKEEGEWGKRQKRTLKWMHQEYTVKEVDGKVDEIKRRCDMKLVPRPESREAIIHSIHMRGKHTGIENVERRVRQEHYWPTLAEDVSTIIRQCEPCLVSGRLRRCRPIGGKFTASRLFGTISVDLVVGIKASAEGYTAMLVVVDVFSRWIEVVPLKSKSSKEVARGLVEGWFMRYGVPDKIISDKGGEYNSAIMEEVVKILRTQHYFSAPYLHQGNGIVERVNGVVMGRVRACVAEMKGWKEWVNVLPYVMHAIRTERHHTLGLSPFEAIFGIEPSSNMDISEEQRLKLIGKLRTRIEKRILERAGKQHTYIGRRPVKGDIVFVKDECVKKSDQRKYVGPYIVVKEGENGTLEMKKVTEGLPLHGLTGVMTSGGSDITRNVNQVVLSELQVDENCKLVRGLGSRAKKKCEIQGRVDNRAGTKGKK